MPDHKRSHILRPPPAIPHLTIHRPMISTCNTRVPGNYTKTALLYTELPQKIWALQEYMNRCPKQ
uniref:Uncharacterized protein n=1 Tax=Arundo donax TaxID=35708 RepID=A0A0A9H3U2_ARUDO